MPIVAPVARLPEARYLTAGNIENYFHWMMDLIGRAVPLTEADTSVMLLPQPRNPFQQEGMPLLGIGEHPTLLLTETTRVSCDRLHFLPELSGGGFNPHGAIATVFDRVREAAIGPAPYPQNRRIYVSRGDTKQRPLLNETAVIDIMTAFGFEVISLTGRSFQDQARIFASASHIVAPHGAGLVNLLFCQPGTKVLELHMDAYVHWAFRRICGLRQLKYGCVVGRSPQPWKDWVHDTGWTIDPAAVMAALRDPHYG